VRERPVGGSPGCCMRRLRASAAEDLPGPRTAQRRHRTAGRARRQRGRQPHVRRPQRRGLSAPVWPRRSAAPVSQPPLPPLPSPQPQVDYLYWDAAERAWVPRRPAACELASHASPGPAGWRFHNGTPRTEVAMEKTHGVWRNLWYNNGRRAGGLGLWAWRLAVGARSLSSGTWRPGGAAWRGAAQPSGVEQRSRCSRSVLFADLAPILLAAGGTRSWTGPITWPPGSLAATRWGAGGARGGLALVGSCRQLWRRAGRAAGLPPCNGCAPAPAANPRAPAAPPRRRSARCTSSTRRRSPAACPGAPCPATRCCSITFTSPTPPPSATGGR
jgi:hypothetical protein